MNYFLRRLLLLPLCLLFSLGLSAQFLMDMIDTTHEMGKGVLSVYRKFDHIRIGGYLQPQFQLASREGVANYSGGDFSQYSDSRFTIRRGRIRFDYAHFDKLNRPTVQFVFQFDGSERGVFIRDFWGRIWENKFESFAFTAGMFARPFGYEVNLASVDRESPERGRASQILMRTERDLGAMVTYEPRKQNSSLRFIRIDLGLFNGQGLSGPTDFDSYKDLISQIVLKPVNVAHHLKLSGGLSLLSGGVRQFSNYTFHVGTNTNGDKAFIVDSTETSPGDKIPRQYYGANAQLKWIHDWGNTEIRGEYWQGTQTATEKSTETPGTVPVLPNGQYAPWYVRHFNSAFFYFLQHIVNSKHQLVLKLDWYDPNTDVEASDIGKSGSNLNGADIKYTTFGFGYNYYIKESLKLLLWYDIVKAEGTQLDATKGARDYEILTCRLQFRF